MRDVLAKTEFHALIRFGMLLADDSGYGQTDALKNVSISTVADERWFDMQTEDEQGAPYAVREFLN
jgi:hypothetical protein